MSTRKPKVFAPRATYSLEEIKSSAHIPPFPRPSSTNEEFKQQTEACAMVESPYIYSYKQFTDQLFRTDLLTGEFSCHQVPSYTFRLGCCWTELPAGNIVITGGGLGSAATKVNRIETLAEFRVSGETSMLSSRNSHAAVYYGNFLYVLGGLSNTEPLSGCERYDVAQRQWDALPPLPRPAFAMTGVVLEGSLYALGGNDGDLDSIQKLNLKELTWELMHLKLPHPGCAIACFKLRGLAYLVLHDTLFSFKPKLSQILPVETLQTTISSWFGQSCYLRGTLYCSYYRGSALSIEVRTLG